MEKIDATERLTSYRASCLGTGESEPLDHGVVHLVGYASYAAPFTGLAL